MKESEQTVSHLLYKIISKKTTKASSSCFKHTHTHVLMLRPSQWIIQLWAEHVKACSCFMSFSTASLGQTHCSLICSLQARREEEMLPLQGTCHQQLMGPSNEDGLDSEFHQMFCIFTEIQLNTTAQWEKASTQRWFPLSRLLLWFPEAFRLPEDWVMKSC